MDNYEDIDREAYEQELESRWSWISEDIEDSDLRTNTNIVLENSYREMVKQGFLKRGLLEEVLTEAPVKSNAVGDYVIPKVMFPLIRRVMPELMANKLVSTQPLTAPTGIIYYITYQYSNTKGNISKLDEFSANPQQTSPAFATWYTSEKIGPFEAEAATADTDIVIDGGQKITDFLGTDLTGYRIKRFEVVNLTTGKGVPVIYDATGNATISFVAATGEITISGSLVEDTPISISSRTKPIAVGDKVFVFLVYDQESSNKIPEMEFTINYMTANTTERKLKIRWTKEAEQDMQAYHKIDVEQELVKVASIQTDYEVDRELMRFIDSVIIPELTFSHDWANDNYGVGGNNTRGNYLDRHRALAQKLYFASTQIAAYNHLGPATWAVCSPQVAALLMMLPDWQGSEISGKKSTFYNAGYLGNGSLTIYVDPNRVGAQANEITLGYKSDDSTYGAGIVYSPYANWMTNTIVQPDNFDNIRGFFSRYALTKVIRSCYSYAKVIINNYM
jgi:hypothetical protein